MYVHVKLDNSRHHICRVMKIFIEKDFDQETTHVWTSIPNLVHMPKNHIHPPCSTCNGKLQQELLRLFIEKRLFVSHNYLCITHAWCWGYTGTPSIWPQSMSTPNSMKLGVSWQLSNCHISKTYIFEFVRKITHACNFFIDVVCNLKDSLHLSHK